MLPQPAVYSTTISKVMIEQISKLRSATIRVKGWDAIPTTIYRKEDSMGRGIGKSLEGEKQGKREKKVSIVRLKSVSLKNLRSLAKSRKSLNNNLSLFLTYFFKTKISFMLCLSKHC